HRPVLHLDLQHLLVLERERILAGGLRVLLEQRTVDGHGGLLWTLGWGGPLPGGHRSVGSRRCGGYRKSRDLAPTATRNGLTWWATTLSTPSELCSSFPRTSSAAAERRTARKRVQHPIEHTTLTRPVSS